jgi:hypothetical protein
MPGDHRTLPAAGAQTTHQKTISAEIARIASIYGEF